MLVGAYCSAYAADAVAPPVDVEMLEYLGEFSTADGGWLDPQVLSDASMLERSSTQAPENAEDEPNDAL